MTQEQAEQKRINEVKKQADNLTLKRKFDGKIITICPKCSYGIIYGQPGLSKQEDVYTCPHCDWSGDIIDYLQTAHNEDKHQAIERASNTLKIKLYKASNPNDKRRTAEPKVKGISLKYTQEEYDFYADMAEKCGVSISNFLRCSLMYVATMVDNGTLKVTQSGIFPTRIN